MQEIQERNAASTTTRTRCGGVSTAVNTRSSEHHVPTTFREEVVLAVDVDHAVLQDALPFVLNSSDLTTLMSMNDTTP